VTEHSDDTPSGRAKRLKSYEQRTSTLMVLLAAGFLVLYAVQVLAVDLPQWLRLTTQVINGAIWLVFVIDLVIRVLLADNRLTYLLRHPIEVVALILPMFRFLRILRVITAGDWLATRRGRLAVGRTATATVIAVLFVATVAALGMLDAERTATDANITDFGEALWWAFTTMSTVGYGDTYPVTPPGRFLAVIMMLMGVSLLGIVSATLAANFLARTQLDAESEAGVERMLAAPGTAGTVLLFRKVEDLERKIIELTAVLNSPENTSPMSTDSSSTTTSAEPDPAERDGSTGRAMTPGT